MLSDLRICVMSGESAKDKTIPPPYINAVSLKQLNDRIATLEQQNAELEKALAEARKDAERYQWIRKWTGGAADTRGRQEFTFPDPHPLGNILKGSVAQHLDAAIDAAIKEQT